MGLVWNKSSVAWSGPIIEKKVNRTNLLKLLLEEQTITQVMIEGVKESFYVLTDYLGYEEEIEDKLTFIAPLDNFIWDRALIKEIFNFEYTWEVYTPTKQRQYGYYVLPMLYKDEFVGRIEFKHYREGPLEVINVWWQNKPKKRPLNKALKKFEKYLEKGVAS